MKTISTILAAAAIFGAAQVSNQAITAIYFAEDPGNGENGSNPAPHPNSTAKELEFLSALTGGAGTENFETFANNSTSPLILTFPGAGNAILGGDGSIQGAPNNVGRFAVSGVKYWEANTSFSIQFLAPVAAFGFYGVDIGDFAGELTLAVTGVNGNSVINVGNSTANAGGGILYFGYINTDNPFTSITFGNTTSAEGVLGDAFAFDDMTIGSVEQVVGTPEVGSTLMLMGAAIGGLSLVRRFKA